MDTNDQSGPVEPTECKWFCGAKERETEREVRVKVYGKANLEANLEANSVLIFTWTRPFDGLNSLPLCG